jgi:hypothetical protein
MLLFNSIIAGSFLLLVSFLICALITVCFKSQVEAIKSFFPVQIAFFGTAVGSFFLAILITFGWNRFLNPSSEITRAIDKIGNELELLLKLSCNQSTLIQITLANNKVYIGWVEILPVPGKSSYVRIIPAMSGYRNSEKKFHVTEVYTKIYADYIEEGIIRSVDELQINLVIKINEIITATRFDFDIYQRFALLKRHETA